MWDLAVGLLIVIDCAVLVSIADIMIVSKKFVFFILETPYGSWLVGYSWWYSWGRTDPNNPSFLINTYIVNTIKLFINCRMRLC